MKTIIFYSLLTATTCIGCQNAPDQSKKTEFLIASSCRETEATCSGNKYCSACKNCKYCKNCAQNGGSCRVCK